MARRVFVNWLMALRYKGEIGYIFSLLAYRIYRYVRYDRLSDTKHIRMRFRSVHGYDINLDHPITLNEKLQWLKLHDRKDTHIKLADKLGVRDYISAHFGVELLPELLLVSDNYKDIRPELLPEVPFIIKATHDSGTFFIVRDKSSVDWKRVRTELRWALSFNYYFIDREWQYRAIKPRIVVERLLLTEAGKIPDDIKINCINGRAEFVYVAYDREGSNLRAIFDTHWSPLPVIWSRKEKAHRFARTLAMPRPMQLDRMLEIAETVAINYPYVRVDFYDVNGRIFLGEITQCHGGGYDQMLPFEWDVKFGALVDLTTIPTGY